MNKKLHSGQALRRSSGQALLLVLLAMAVVLTVVLSVVSRSVTDVAITTYEVDSLRAFSAAEAGIEDALSKTLYIGYNSSDSVGTGAYSYEITNSIPPDGSLYSPGNLSSGESATVWFVSHNTGGGFVCDDDGGLPCTELTSVDLCWGNDETDPPAIEVSFYYDSKFSESSNSFNGDYSGIKVKKLVYDHITNRDPPNYFDSVPPETTGCGTDYEYGAKNYNLISEISNCVNSGCLIYAKIRLLYNNNPQPVAIVAGTLPSQGILINSTGTQTETKRKVQVFQAYPEPPEIFDNVLFTEGSI